MEPEGSLPHSQVPVTCPYPEPHRYNDRHNCNYNFTISRSRWPYRLKLRFAAAPFLGSWVRIPLRACVFVSCVYCVMCGYVLCICH